MSVITAPVSVAACGMDVPEQVVTNEDMARLVNTSGEWIVQRTNGTH
jgi:3-oxoacyl-[acyl-carrier-protein] synthase III